MERRSFLTTALTLIPCSLTRGGDHTDDDWGNPELEFRDGQFWLYRESLGPCLIAGVDGWEAWYRSRSNFQQLEDGFVLSLDEGRVSFFPPRLCAGQLKRFKKVMLIAQTHNGRSVPFAWPIKRGVCYPFHGIYFKECCAETRAMILDKYPNIIFECHEARKAA